jgi:NADPH-dependent curcumin reductase CurA
MPQNQKIILASRPSGAASLDNFQLVNEPIGEPAEGEILVRHHFLSLDPYMRGRMNASKSYAEPQKLGEVMVGGTLGEVVASRSPDFKAGEFVVGLGGWQLYRLVDGRGLTKVPDLGLPLSLYLGAIGMPGVTAWYGIREIIAPKKGETIVVSAATGAVGSVAGQLAKLAGARTIGIAGGPEKCRLAVEAFGFDLCLDHRAADFQAAFARANAAGIDGLFENVGGLPLNLALTRLNPFARVALCGLVASGYDGTPTPVADIAPILTNRVRIQGFIISDHPDIWPRALAELAGLVGQGRLKYRETIAQGLAAAPAAFLDLLKGRNIGKQIVKLT